MTMMKQHLSLGALLALLAIAATPCCSFMVGSTTLMKTTTRSFLSASEEDKDDEEPDLLEYFDPLKSPHEYPNGISPDHLPSQMNEPSPKPDTYTDPKIDNVLDPIPIKKKKKTTTTTPNVFDPLLSPHEYPNGTPNEIGDASASEVAVGDDDDASSKPTKIGILLMDHGSRNPESNERLHELAVQYQETVNDSSSNIIVQAAHMELANPTISEGIEKLLNQGVDEIICHPYFLSPHGRHVAEDLPRIIQEATESLGIKIPLTITDPVGAHFDVMIGAIQSIVEQAATSSSKGQNNQ